MKKSIAGVMVMAGLVGASLGQTTVLDPALDKRPVAGTQAAGEIPPDLLTQAHWKVETGGSGFSSQRIELFGSDLLVSRTSSVRLLEGRTGKQLWEMPSTKLGIQASPNDTYEIVESLGPTTGLASSGKVVRGDGLLAGITLPDGEQKWKATFKGFIPLPVVDGQLIITGAITESHHVSGLGGPRTVRGTGVAMDVRALDRDTGEQKWSTPLPAGTLYTGKPLVFEGQVVVVADLSTPDKNQCQVLSLRARDGAIVYRSLRDDLLSPPALVNGELVMVSSKAKVVGLDLSTGNEKWEVAISPDIDPTRSTFTSIPGSKYLEEPPVVAGDKILVSAVGATNPPRPPGPNNEDRTAGLAAFDVRTHKQVWYCAGPADHTPPPSHRAPQRNARELWLREVQTGGDLIVAYGTGMVDNIVGIDRQQGKLLFANPAVKSASNHPSVISGNTWYVVVDHMVYAIPVETALKAGGRKDP